MAYENVRITEPNFVRVDGYFYHITALADDLFKITDDGTIAYSYPLDTDIQYPVQSIEHDGYNFWTLENPPGNNIIIRRWEIKDFVAQQVRRYLITGSSSQKFDAKAFAIEHFHRNFTVAASAGTNTITINDTSRILPGHRMRLGPSTFVGDEGKSEQIVVLEVLGGNQVRFTSNLVNSYNQTDSISSANRCWIFNKFRPSDPDPTNGSGQLYSFDIFDSVTFMNARAASLIYRDVIAATFLKDPADNRDYLTFMNQANLLFMETQIGNPNFLSVVKSATQNNQEVNTTIIPVHEITHEGSTLFRLQNKATYRVGATTTTTTWTTPPYNYQLSTLNRLPQSISLVADNGILSADGVSTTDITATVKDQFDDPLSSRQVNFSDNDTLGADPGFVSPTSATTNAQGKAVTTYRVGTQPNVVTILART